MKIVVDPPFAEPLSRGVVCIQYRSENLRIVPVFGPKALDVSPRIGHLHVAVDGAPWVSFPTIISGRIGDAVQPGRECWQHPRPAERLALTANSSAQPGECATDCSSPRKRKGHAEDQPRPRSPSDPGTRGAAGRSIVLQRHSAMAIQEQSAGRGSHHSDSSAEDMSVGSIIVTHRANRCHDPWERPDDLPRKPLRRRMPGHLKRQQPPSAVSHNQEGKQPIEGYRRHHTDRSRRWPRRDCAERSASSVTAACGRASCISGPSTEPPRSPASTARRGSGTHPTTGFPGSSAGSDHADLGQSSAALPASTTSSANRL